MDIEIKILITVLIIIGQIVYIKLMIKQYKSQSKRLQGANHVIRLLLFKMSEICSSSERGMSAPASRREVLLYML